MSLSGRRSVRRSSPRNPISAPKPVPDAPPPLREFAYLDDVTVQSLLVSQIGALPSEVTSLSTQSAEAEVGGALSLGAPLMPKAELTSRFASSTGSSNQVLSRAVSESLFKHLYDLISDRLVYSPGMAASGDSVPIKRGDLIEIEVDLAADPIYGFSATMGVFSELAEGYPAFLDNPGTALVMAEAEPINKVLERLLVGLIPIKAVVNGLVAEEENGQVQVRRADSVKDDAASTPLFIVGVTEQEKYWRDVRRVLFSQSRFSVLGRISRSGVQASWTPVKLTEVMRDIAPAFPDAITRVGRVGYAAPLNTKQELNRAALEIALEHFAATAGGENARQQEQAIQGFAKTLRDSADSLTQQTQAFDRLTEWLIQRGILEEKPENSRALRSEARQVAGLRLSSEPSTLSDLGTTGADDELPEEHLIDLEIIAIYW